MRIRMFKDGAIRDVTPDVAERLFEYGTCEIMAAAKPKAKPRPKKKAVNKSEPEREAGN